MAFLEIIGVKGRGRNANFLMTSTSIFEENNVSVDVLWRHGKVFIEAAVIYSPRTTAVVK